MMPQLALLAQGSLPKSSNLNEIILGSLPKCFGTGVAVLILPDCVRKTSHSRPRLRRGCNGFKT